MANKSDFSEEDDKRFIKNTNSKKRLSDKKRRKARRALKRSFG